MDNKSCSSFCMDARHAGRVREVPVGTQGQRVDVILDPVTIKARDLSGAQLLADGHFNAFGPDRREYCWCYLADGTLALVPIEDIEAA